MPDLTEERKQQIRDEEAAKFRRLQQEEQLFREQVRRELELGSHAEVAPLASPPPATLSEPKFDIGPTVRPSKTQPQSSSSKRAIFFAVLLGVLGVGFMAYAARSGFRLPRFGQGQDIALKADSSGELVDLDEARLPEGRLQQLNGGVERLALMVEGARLGMNERIPLLDDEQVPRMDVDRRAPPLRQLDRDGASRDLFRGVLVFRRDRRLCRWTQCSVLGNDHARHGGVDL